eukprot:TRINITY_DN22108_c0_g1_i1.p1 TRINITY_DN22108_c0_g1~~TRINITY_DN22108_c0_g1_i1.p1  ORF type:complete len:374 (-),score=49.92 TRINITY_DN22108_c0_g1_i1:34-996(-)
MRPAEKIRMYKINSAKDALQLLCDDWFPSHHIPSDSVVDVEGARSIATNNSISSTAVYKGTQVWRKRIAINSCLSVANVQALLSPAFNEIATLVSMRPSPILTKFLGFTVDLGRDHVQVTLDLLFELIDCETLHDVMDAMFQRGQPFSLKETCIIARGMLNIGIELKERRLLHFDFKPANVLYNRKTGKLLLVDFASSTTITNPPGVMQSFDLCTPQYQPSDPIKQRVLAGKGDAMDMSAMGMIIHEMMRGEFLTTSAKLCGGCFGTRKLCCKNMSDFINKLVNAEWSYEDALDWLYSFQHSFPTDTCACACGTPVFFKK